MSDDPVLELSKLKFGWTQDSTLISIDTFALAKGESVFLRGASGSGKSTLLGLISGILPCRSGSIQIKGQDITQKSSAVRDRIRSDHLGIIFQQFNLLPYLSVLANISLPCRFSKKRKHSSETSYASIQDEALSLLTGLGLPANIIDTPVAQLSVGQQQRVAVARALIGNPDLIIADEPTSGLDTDNRDKFIELLNTQRERFSTSLLFVSHDRSLAKHFDRETDFTALNRSSLETNFT